MLNLYQVYITDTHTDIEHVDPSRDRSVLRSVCLMGPPIRSTQDGRACYHTAGYHLDDWLDQEGWHEDPGQVRHQKLCYQAGSQSSKKAQICE